MYDLTFHPEQYVRKSVTVEGREIFYRAYENIVYVADPVDTRFQSLNIYVPEGLEHEQETPIFFRNYVGGYMSTPPVTPEPDQEPAFLGLGLRYALKAGLVAVSPGARGREDVTDGKFTGKAPADIVDLKAAIRYLRHNAELIPGNVERIISDGSSAGGAMSALLGTTGNSPDYEPYLREIGAAAERDDVFAAICFCPIIDLEHANGAYEWQFGSVRDFHMMKPRVVDNELVFDPVDIHMDEKDAALSRSFAGVFGNYVNDLALRDPETGEGLALDPETGTGTYLTYMLRQIGRSATEYLAGILEEERAAHLADRPWLRWNGETAEIDPERYAEYTQSVSRGKPCPSFDGFDCEITENSLFGTETRSGNHFDDALEQVTGNTGAYAVPEEMRGVIALMNPMAQVQKAGNTIAPHFYIRWGTKDSNHSYAAPMNLALLLENSGRCPDVNFKFQWLYDHDGDYCLDEMFGWIAEVCR